MMDIFLFLREHQDIIRELGLWEYFEKGDYVELLENDNIKSIYSCLDENDLNFVAMTHYLQDHPHSGLPLLLKRQVTVLCLVTAHLNLFVQYNWTGPTAPENQNLWPFSIDKLQTSALKELTLDDGGSPYQKTQIPQSLWFCRCILLSCKEQLQHIRGYSRLLFHCLVAHQKILDDRSPTICNMILSLIESENVDHYSKQDAILFHLDVAYISYFYYEYALAKTHFQQAKDLCPLTFELTGSMGKRTRFQQKELAQMRLKVTRIDGSDVHEAPQSCSDLPKIIPLNDDTVFNEVKYTDAYTSPVLTAVEQACLLGQCFMNEKSRASDEDLLREESLAFIQALFEQPLDWSIHMVALFIRCRLEKNSGRRVERTMMQLEEMVKAYEGVNPLSKSRLKLTFTANLPPMWKVKELNADVLRSLGLTKAALDLYLSLESWENIISCYESLGQHQKAEAVVRGQLAIQETPDLWCHLGDVTKDKTHYETAWRISGQRSARAMKYLAYHYMVEKQYEICLESFEKSLFLNSMQPGVWFSYGCAALAIEKFDLAVKAFRRCVHLNPESFEAWNNLASALVKLNDKSKAFKIYQEALKQDYENWKIWDNYMLVAMDVGEFSEAIRAYHRLLDIKEKWTDAKVLEILVQAVTTNILDASGRSAERLYDKLLELLGRVTSMVTGHSSVWKSYSSLVLGDNNPTPEKLHKGLQFQLKSVRCLVQEAGWDKDLNKCEDITTSYLELSQAHRKHLPMMNNSQEKTRLLSSAKLPMKSCISQLKKQYENPVTKEITPPQVKDWITQLDNELDQLNEMLAACK